MTVFNSVICCKSYFTSNVSHCWKADGTHGNDVPSCWL